MHNKDLPNGWKIAKLKDFVVERKEKNKLNEELTVFSVSNKRGLVKSDDYFEGQVYSKDLKSYKKILKYDFGYNPARINVGSIACMDNYDIGLLSPMYVIFSLKEGINIDYFKFFLKGNLFNKQVNNFTQGAVRQILNFKDLGKIQILLPPLDIQEKIAGKLKENTKLIEESEEQINKYELIKKAMMKKLFSEGIGHREFKKDEYFTCDIPKNWENIKMGEIIKSTQLGINEPSSVSNDGIPLLKMQNILIGDFDLRDEKLNKIESSSLVGIENYIVNNGDFLFNTRNSYELVGKSSTWKTNNNVFLFNSNIMRILFKDYINPFYINYFFSFNFGWKQLKSITKGTTSVAAIYYKDLKLVKVLVPSLKEQNKIVDIIENIETLIEKEKEIRKSYENIKKGLVSMVYSCSLLIK